MRGCEILFDEPKLRVAKELCKSATGQRCACDRGHRCPILPASITVSPRVGGMNAHIAEVVDGYKLLDPTRRQLLLDAIALKLAEQRAERAAMA